MNVTSKTFFNVTSSVACTGGECGYINATLDPYVTYFFSFENATGPDPQGWTHNVMPARTGAPPGSPASAAMITGILITNPQNLAAIALSLVISVRII